MIQMIIGLGLKLLEAGVRVIKWIGPSLKIEIFDFQYVEVRNSPGNSVVHITAYPLRYHVELALTNRTDSVVYIKQISVTINGNKTFQVSSVDTPIRLEARQYAEKNIIFPISKNDDAAANGEFCIDITPATGRMSRVRGSFPIKDAT